MLTPSHIRSASRWRARHLRAVVDCAVQGRVRDARMHHVAAMTAARAQLRARLTTDEGATTAEYAIVIGAAVGFAGLLVVILRSGEVQAVLTQLVTDSLGAAG